jgi:hypothetical protein
MKTEGAVILRYHRNVRLNISAYPKYKHGVEAHVIEHIVFLNQTKKQCIMLCAPKFTKSSLSGIIV